MHCRQVQVKSLDLVLTFSANLVRCKSKTVASVQPEHELPYSAALRTFYECFEIFLDDHKENALNATFVEPTRFYWAKTAGRHETPGFLVDNVETHAVNWYI